MKDFRVYNATDASEPVGPTMGGSAFSLPNIPLSGLLTSLGVGSIAMLLQPWRLMRVLPFRRGGLIGSFFSWGRLATIVLATMLVLSPSSLQQSFPEWRTLAAVCFFVSGVSVLGAISRCCGSALSCAFWVALTLFMGEKAFRPGQLSGLLDNRSFWQSATIAAPDELPVLIEEGEWEDMVTGEPVSARAVSYSVAPRPRSVQAISRRRVASAQAPVMVREAGVFDGITQGFSNQLNSIVPGAGLAAMGSSRGWRDGAALPDSAYFGNGQKFGAVGEAFASGSDSPLGDGLDGILGQVGALLGK